MECRLPQTCSMTNTDPRSLQTAARASGEASRRRWVDKWPVLIPLLLVSGLLWMSLWYSRRAQLLEEASFVEFDAARRLRAGLVASSTTDWRIGITSRHSSPDVSRGP